VSGGVVAEFAFVVATGDHRPIDHHDSTDRYIAVFYGGPGLVDGEAHEYIVGWVVGHAATIAAS
jgi:hypothetical protein